MVDYLDGDSADLPLPPPVADLLQLLVQSESMPPLADLVALSDLTRADQELLRDSWPLVPVERRRQLIEILVEQSHHDLTLDLGRMLRVTMEDQDPEVRSLSLDGFWEETAADLVGPIVQLLHNDEESQVREAAARSLGAFVLAGELDELDASLAMRAEEALLSVLQSDVEPIEVQCRALESIAYSGETGVRQLIEDAYYSPDEELRVSALVAMGRSADSRWRGFVRAELQNPSAAMRTEAAMACGELEMQAALGDLLLLLEDDEEPVRLAAIFALGRLGGREAQRALSILRESENPTESAAADDALEEMLFYAAGDEIALLGPDEEENDDDWDAEPWDRDDDEQLGSYGD